MQRWPFILTLVVAVATGATAQQASKRLQINDVNWTPFFMQGPRKGFAHELLQIFLAGRKQLHFFQLLPPPRSEAYMRTGEIDLCVYSSKKEREEFLWYGQEAIFTIEYRIAIRSDFDLSVSKLEDLEPCRLGRIRGIAYSPQITAFLDRQGAAGKIEVTKDLTSQVQMLAAGRIDALIEATAAIGWEAAELGLTKQIRFVGPVLSTKPYFLTVAKASANIRDGPGFLATFDAWLRGFKTRPAFAALVRKYGVQ